MRYVTIILLLLSLVLLGVVIREADLGNVSSVIGTAGAGGIAAVALLYLTVYLADSVSWQLTLVSLPVRLRWVARVANIHLIGEALNRLSPFAIYLPARVRRVLAA